MEPTTWPNMTTICPEDGANGINKLQHCPPWVQDRPDLAQQGRGPQHPQRLNAFHKISQAILAVLGLPSLKGVSMCQSDSTMPKLIAKFKQSVKMASTWAQHSVPNTNKETSCGSYLPSIWHKMAQARPTRWALHA